MAKAILVRNSSLLDQIVTRFELSISSAKKFGEIRVLSNESLVCIFDPLFSSVQLQEIFQEYSIDALYFLDFAEGIGSEVRTGDILLPSFFFSYDRNVETLEEDRAHFAGIGKEAVFLENYETQGDYDFGEFAMSIGGGVASLGNTSIPERPLFGKISAAYGIDALDTIGYEVVKALNEKISTYVILSLKGDRSGTSETIENEKKLAISAVEITKFLLESTSEEEFIKIAEEGEIHTEEGSLTDDEYDE